MHQHVAHWYSTHIQIRSNNIVDAEVNKVSLIHYYDYNEVNNKQRVINSMNNIFAQQLRQSISGASAEVCNTITSYFPTIASLMQFIDQCGNKDIFIVS